MMHWSRREGAASSTPCPIGVVSEAVEVLASVEGVGATLENVLGMRADLPVIERSDAIRSRLAMLPVSFECHDQLCIAEHGHVRVVRADDDLARSEERRVGKDGVSTCRYRGSP